MDISGLGLCCHAHLHFFLFEFCQFLLGSACCRTSITNRSFELLYAFLRAGTAEFSLPESRKLLMDFKVSTKKIIFQRLLSLTLCSSDMICHFPLTSFSADSASCNCHGASGSNELFLWNIYAPWKSTWKHPRPKAPHKSR